MRRISIEFQTSACIALALGLLILPLSWILSAAAAAIAHEMGHAAMILLTGGRITGLRIAAGGAVMETEPMGRGREFLCTLAGPAASIGLLVLARQFPTVAACALLQGIFNLLPLYPLDGGRMLRCLVGMPWASVIEFVVLTGILLGAIIVFIKLQSGYLLLTLAVFVVCRAVSRKYPCKAEEIRVQ